MGCTLQELLADIKGPFPTPEEALTAAEVADPTLLPFAKEEDTDHRSGFISAIRGDYLEAIKEACQSREVPLTTFARIALCTARVTKGENNPGQGGIRPHRSHVIHPIRQPMAISGLSILSLHAPYVRR